MADARIPVTGGCLCGAVRYQSSDPPSEGFYCHCRTCQKRFSGLFGAYVRMARSLLAFTRGEPRYYRSSEVARRGLLRGVPHPVGVRL